MFGVKGIFQLRFDIGREAIKIVALITMTIDHVGASIYPEYEVLRFIGRLSFPLYAYLIVLGMESTRNVKRYFGNLFLFAVISQTPYFLAFGQEPFEELNVLFTLSFSILFLSLLSPIRRESILSLFPLLIAGVLNFDYGIYGIAFIFCIFLMKKDTKIAVFLLVVLNAMFLLTWMPQVLSLLAIPIILLHRNEAVKKDIEINEKAAYFPLIKYSFYIYYPLHLTLLYLIKP